MYGEEHKLDVRYHQRVLCNEIAFKRGKSVRVNTDWPPLIAALLPFRKGLPR